MGFVKPAISLTIIFLSSYLSLRALNSAEIEEPPPTPEKSNLEQPVQPDSLETGYLEATPPKQTINFDCVAIATNTAVGLDFEWVDCLPPIDATVYAYSSTVDQTDEDPFTTASGQKVRAYIVANNCLEFGTKVVILDEVYEVQDRMDERYGCSDFDIWKPTTAEAKEWGKKQIPVTIIKQ